MDPMSLRPLLTSICYLLFAMLPGAKRLESKRGIRSQCRMPLIERNSSIGFPRRPAKVPRVFRRTRSNRTVLRIILVLMPNDC
jgi:hypothetical protein